MRKATRIVTAALGATAGLAGVEHGIFEIQRGNTIADSLVIASLGPPCVPEEIWNSCEPAMTIIPNYLMTGILAVILGLLVFAWAIFFSHRKSGSVVLFLLSLVLLLFGGGFFPPLIGFVGSFAGIKINKPIQEKDPNRLLRFFSRLWPWPLVVFLVWVWGQIPTGYFFNDFMTSIMYFGIALILLSMPISIFTAYARDAVTARRGA